MIFFPDMRNNNKTRKEYEVLASNSTIVNNQDNYSLDADSNIEANAETNNWKNFHKIIIIQNKQLILRTV